MKIMTLLPPENNFADLRESADILIAKADKDSLGRLAAIVGKLLYRCDLLEREVERLSRAGAKGRP